MTELTAQQALAPLRQQIDSIDSQLVALLAQRAKVTAQVGKIKQQFALPVYVPEREQALLSARREQAQELGVSADLAEDVLRRIMRESYQTQESGFVCCREGGGKVVVVGAGPAGLSVALTAADRGQRRGPAEQQPQQQSEPGDLAHATSPIPTPPRRRLPCCSRARARASGRCGERARRAIAATTW